MQQYWHDAQYTKAISQAIPMCAGVVHKGLPAPLLRLSLCEVEWVDHLASLPGFLSVDNLNDLKEQITVIKRLKSPTVFLQYRGSETEVEMKALLSEILGGNRFLLQQRTRVQVSVNQNNDALISRCRKDTRSRVRQILKSGYIARQEYNEKFANLYGAIAQKNKFSKSYCYDNKDLLDISKASGIINISVYSPEGGYVGGAVLGHVNAQEADYILSAYDAKYPNAGRAVLWSSLVEARSLGCSTLNLGGGVQEGDSLYDYKKSFGGDDVPFYTIKIIFDEQLYRDSYGVEGDISLEGRFPK